MSYELIRQIDKLEARIARLERPLPSHYKGAQAGDFTTTTLPHHGDYGFQTTDNELQMNCNGTIRAVALAAL
jgi:hypothetical protein